MEANHTATVIGIARHRILRDGKGITTLVGLKGCPLSCAYCLNREALRSHGTEMTGRQLYDAVKKDDLYFRATEGGITFGGGEPLLNVGFIREFRALCPASWRLNIETSLCVGRENVVKGAEVADTLIVDVKSLDPIVYRSYTGESATGMIENLRYLAENPWRDKITVKVPFIPGYTRRGDVAVTLAAVRELGFRSVTTLDYRPIKVPRPPRKPDAYGKKVCRVLRYVRNAVAESYGIACPDDDCKATVCTGTCPKCEAELRSLTRRVRLIDNK